QVQFYPGAWGEYEWECVELSMRFMLEAWGVPPYPADGNDVVANYPDGAPGYPGLQKVGNGTVGRPPEPGDVLSIKDGDSFGHTEVVASTDVNGAGNGTIRAIAENWTEHMSGFVNLFVSHWVVSDGVAGNKVLGWLHNPSWSLELPVLWAISSSGNLEIKSSGTLGGSWTTVAADISAARVAGGGGSDPSPLVAGLTTSGTLEAGPLAYDTALSPVASGVAPGPRSFAISSGWGMRGRPLLAYVTRSGALELVSGSLRSAPVTLLGGDVRQVVVAAGSGPGNAFIGILTDAGHFEVAEGAVSGPLAWQSVASGVSAIALAGGGESSADALVAFVQHGRVFEREGPAGAFDLVGTGARALALASVGPSAVPLVAEVTGGGDLEISLGAQVPVLVATSVATVSLDAGPTQMGFPVLAYLSSNHEMSASDGRLDSSPRQEATGVMSMGAAALTVS
ncbi:MAG: CHAP domain-containing protein, partial [Acidimicrobiales bacterium]